MNAATVIALVLTLLAQHGAAGRPAAAAAGRERSPELRALVDDAGLCSPELRADAFLRLARRAGAEDSSWRRELVEAAYAAASDARLEYPLGIWHAGMSTDSDDGILLSAGETGLDALTLRCRAIDLTVETDPARALDMFRAIDVASASEPVRCDRATLPDLRVYYDALATVVERCFTPKQRAKGDDVVFALPYFSKLRSPVEAGPALRAAAVLAARDRAKFSPLVGALRVGLEGSSADRCAFMWAAIWGDLAKSYGELLAAYGGDAALRRDLDWGYRKLLVKNLSARRCVFRGAKPRPGPPDVVVSYNLAVPEERAIRPEEIAPAGVEEIDYDPHEWWTSVASSAAMLAIQRLNFKDDKEEPFSAEDRAGEAYRALYDDAVAKNEAWTSTDEASEEVYFQMKCLLSAGLVDRAPTPELRDAALDRYVHFVEVSPLVRSKPAQWILSLRLLLDDLAEGDANERRRLVERLLGSREPAVRVFAALALREDAPVPAT